LIFKIWVGCLICIAAAGQQDHSFHRAAGITSELLERPVALHKNIGSAHDPVSPSKEAQAYYDQGLSYLHSFVWIEAARSFHQALKLDANLGLAYVGLSYAYAELNDPSAARSAIERAAAFNPLASEHDRRHVEIRLAQMAAESAPHDAAKLAEYRKSLDEALAKFPSDSELWLQRGVAESPDPSDRGQGSVPGAERYYEQALKIAPEGFTAHHFLAHLYENGGRVDEALKHASTYAALSPAVPHARHMLAHEMRRAGRIDEAITEFETADRLESDYLESENLPAESDWQYQHNLDLLGLSYQYRGEMTKAERLLKRSFAISSSLVVQEFNKREWPAFLLSRGRAPEALDAAKVMITHVSPLIRATGHVYAGRALLALNQFAKAAGEANAALHELNSAGDGGALVAPDLKQLQGEFFVRTGERAKGHLMLDEVAEKASRATGPDEWSQTLFTLESIAKVFRDAGDWESAARTAKRMLEHDPSYGGTHYALGLLADHAGDLKSTKSEFTLAEKFWSKADPDLVELQQIRARRW